MRKSLKLMVMGMPVLGMVLVTTSINGGPVLATPVVGVASTPIAQGRFEEFRSTVKTGDWKMTVGTKGVSDVYVLENRLAPGGTFGWHSHPGPSFVIVKSGTLSVYHADDPTCTATTVTVGRGFVDQGGSIHMVRNETASEVVVVVTSIVPAGVGRRSDEPASSHCPA